MNNLSGMYRQVPEALGAEDHLRCVAGSFSTGAFTTPLGKTTVFSFWK